MIKVLYTFYKNSNTGELIIKKHFDVSFICPDLFFSGNNKQITTPDLIGFVRISERKFLRETRKNK